MKKIAIIGASYLQLPLVLKAKEMGLETHCFAWEEGAVCKEIVDFFYPISIIDKESVFNKCKEIQIDGITTIATDMAVPSICFTAEKLGLVSNSYKSALLSTNKALMRDRFLNSKVNIPKFIKIVEGETVPKNLKFPLIVKPTDRSGSRGVTKIINEIEIKGAIERAINESFSKEAIIEEFIEGQEVSVETISWNGSHYILSITDKITTGEPFFVELAHHQPSILSSEIQDKICGETIKALNALEIKNGAGHSEFKITKEGNVFAIEVGARMGGDFIGSHLIHLSTGYDFLKGVLNCALNKFEPPVLNNNANSGVYFLCEETKKIMPYFEIKNDFDVIKEVQNKELKQIKNSNDRSGYLIYQAPKKIELL